MYIYGWLVGWFTIYIQNKTYVLLLLLAIYMCMVCILKIVGIRMGGFVIANENVGVDTTVPSRVAIDVLAAVAPVATAVVVDVVVVMPVNLLIFILLNVIGEDELTMETWVYFVDVSCAQMADCNAAIEMPACPILRRLIMNASVNAPHACLSNELNVSADVCASRQPLNATIFGHVHTSVAFMVVTDPPGVLIAYGRSSMLPLWQLSNKNMNRHNDDVAVAVAVAAFTISLNSSSVINPFLL